MPENVPGAQPPPIRVDAQKVEDGVYFLAGGSHNSMAVEMKDYIVLVDTPKAEPLCDNIQRRKLAVQMIVPMHGGRTRMWPS